MSKKSKFTSLKDELKELNDLKVDQPKFNKIIPVKTEEKEDPEDNFPTRLEKALCDADKVNMLIDKTNAMEPPFMSQGVKDALIGDLRKIHLGLLREEFMLENAESFITYYDDLV